MIIINLIFCVYAAMIALNFMRNIGIASGIKTGAQVPSLELLNIANADLGDRSQRLSASVGLYLLSAIGIIVGGTFYIFGENSWGGLIAAVVCIANIFSVRGVLAAVRRFMNNCAEEGF